MIRVVGKNSPFALHKAFVGQVKSCKQKKKHIKSNLLFMDSNFKFFHP